MPTLLAPAREFRSIRADVRMANDGSGRFACVAMRYGVLDDYGTLFRPGCFTESLSQRLPAICRNHNWENILGRVISFEDTATELRLAAKFTDITEIPECRRAWLELRNDVINEFSVGFERSAQTEDDKAGGTWIEKAELYETSLVLAGGVPGTSLIGVRTKPERRTAPPLRIEGRSTAETTISVDEVTSLLTRMSIGEMDLHEALGHVKSLAIAVPLDEVEPETPDPEPETPEVEEVETPEEGNDLGEGDGAAAAETTDELLASLGDVMELVDRAK